MDEEQAGHYQERSDPPDKVKVFSEYHPTTDRLGKMKQIKFLQ